MKTTMPLIFLIGFLAFAQPSGGTDYTGIWMTDCSHNWGVQIKSAENQFYSVSFCGPGGCFGPGEWMPNTPIEGDSKFKIISPEKLGIARKGGPRFDIYKKCTSDPTWIAVEPTNGRCGFAPGVINRRPIGAERTKGNNIKSEKTCIKKGGEWFEEKGYYAYCVIPYADAGKLCKNSKDCIGHCIIPLDKKMLDGTPLKEGYGICQINDSTDDCGRWHFEDGKIIIFNCD